jgi:hypothetical protein
MTNEYEKIGVDMPELSEFDQELDACVLDLARDTDKSASSLGRNIGRTAIAINRSLSLGEVTTEQVRAAYENKQWSLLKQYGMTSSAIRSLKRVRRMKFKDSDIIPSPEVSLEPLIGKISHS